MSLLQTIRSQPWAIQPEYLSLIESIAARDVETVDALAKKMGRKMEGTRVTSIRDGVAILPVSGPIVPKANMFSSISGATSLDILSLDLQEAINNPSVHTIMLDVDSPGGAVTGVNQFAEMVKDASSEKKVVAYVQGTGASAAYWIASAASEIILSETACVGSIGVVVSTSVQEAADADGYRDVVVTSSNAKNKRPDLATEEGRAILRQTLDDIETIFIQTVADNRKVSTATVKSEFGQGGVFVGAQAVNAGMADRIMSFEALMDELTHENSNDQPIKSKGMEPMPKNTAEKVEASAQELTVDVLKEQHPEIAQALINEGMQAENERMAGIDELAIKGHEDLIKSLKADQSVSVGDAAIRIVEAEKEIGKRKVDAIAAADDLVSEAAQAHVSSDGEHARRVKGTAKPNSEEQIKEAWNDDQDLQAEFDGDFEAYQAYQQAVNTGQVKALSK